MNLKKVYNEPWLVWIFLMVIGCEIVGLVVLKTQAYSIKSVHSSLEYGNAALTEKLVLTQKQLLREREKYLSEIIHAAGDTVLLRNEFIHASMPEFFREIDAWIELWKAKLEERGIPFHHKGKLSFQGEGEAYLHADGLKKVLLQKEALYYMLHLLLEVRPRDIFRVSIDCKVEPMVFEAEFSGDTEILRKFLNALGRSDLPLWVEDIRVQIKSSNNTQVICPFAQCIVSREDSLFTVNIALSSAHPGYLRLLNKTRDHQLSWEEPEGFFDLFTPPCILLDEDFEESILFALEESRFDLIEPEGHPYRLSFRGYIQMSCSREALQILIYDHDKKHILRNRVGDDLLEGRFKLKQFEIHKIGLQCIPRVILWDNRLCRMIFLDSAHPDLTVQRLKIYDRETQEFFWVDEQEKAFFVQGKEYRILKRPQMGYKSFINQIYLAKNQQNRARVHDRLSGNSIKTLHKDDAD